MNELVKRRPTETLSGLALAAAVYGFLTQADVATATAALLGVVVAFGPALVTAVVDALFVRRGVPLEEAAGEDTVERG